MKTFTNQEIIWLIENCENQDAETCNSCPLINECLYYYTGEKCGSVLEST